MRRTRLIKAPANAYFAALETLSRIFLKGAFRLSGPTAVVKRVVRRKMENGNDEIMTRYDR